MGFRGRVDYGFGGCRYTNCINSESTYIPDARYEIDERVELFHSSVSPSWKFRRSTEIREDMVRFLVLGNTEMRRRCRT
jgi:hypothetical protein